MESERHEETPKKGVKRNKGEKKSGSLNARQK